MFSLSETLSFCEAGTVHVVTLLTSWLTPAHEVERVELLESFERSRDESVEVVTLTQHPRVSTTRQVNLQERNLTTPNL